MWAGFSLGGIAAAFVLPVLILITNLAVPFGLVSSAKLEYVRVTAKLANPVLKIFLLVTLAASLYHAAYRLRSALEELTLAKLGVLPSVISYGLLLVGASVLLYAVLAIR